MLEISIPKTEFFDDSTQEFIYVGPHSLKLEHSLISLSKWESRWNIPYNDETKEKTPEQIYDYIRCMTLNKEKIPDHAYYSLTKKQIDQIYDYIKAPMTATKIKHLSHAKRGQYITAELIYYYMITYGIPFECQKWHLNKLLTLIEVCAEESKPKKKMGQKEQMSQQAALNAARRQKMHSRG